MPITPLPGAVPRFDQPERPLVTPLPPGFSQPSGARRYVTPLPPGERGAAGDAFSGFRPVAEAAGAVGSAIGSAVDLARRIPVVGGALDTVGRFSETVLDVGPRTFTGGIALGADQLLGTGLTRRAQQRAAGRPFWEVPKFASDELGGAFTRIAEDPRQDTASRALGQLGRGAQFASEVATPFAPGLGMAQRLLAVRRLTPKDAALERLVKATATPATRSASAAAGDVASTTPAPGAPSRAPIRIYGEMGTPARDPRDLGYNPSTTFRQLDPEVQSLIKSEATASGGFAAQRRGVQSIAETFRKSVGVDIEEMRRSQPGRAMNAEEWIATAKATARAAERRRILQEQVASHGGAQHAPTELKAQLLLAAVDQASLQRALAGGRSEAARTMRVMREALEQGDIVKKQGAYDRALAEFGGRENAEALIDKLNGLWARNVPDEVKSADTYRFLQQMTKSSRMAKASELWINSILSGLRTHEVNAIGNAMFGWVAVPASRLAAAGIESVSTLGGLRRPREVFFSETAAYAKGMVRGIGVGIRKAMHIAREGYDLEDAVLWAETGRVGRSSAIGGRMGAVVNVPTRLLSASDAIFKTMAYQGELYAQAARIASRERLSGRAWAARVRDLVDDPPDYLLGAAKEQAKYVTFQSDLGPFMQKFLALRRAHPVMSFIVPFVVTPTNLLKRGLEFSPLGVWQARKLTGADRAMALGRAAVGTGVLAIFLDKLFAGEMTAHAPQNPAERDEFYRSGRIPYAIKVGDQWIEYRRFQPLSTPLSWMAAAYQTWRDSGELDQATVYDIVGAITSNLKDDTYLQGIENLVNAMEDPERFFDRSVGGIARGFVPFSSLLRSVAEAGDPLVRDPEGPLEHIAEGIPGLRGTVPPRLDTRGKPVERVPSQQGLGAIINPFRVSPENTDRVDAEVARLARVADLDRVGFVTGRFGDRALSRDEKHRWQELAGRAAREAESRVVLSSTYGRMTDQERAKAIDAARRDAREQARQQFAGEIGEQLARTPKQYVTPLPPVGGAAGVGRRGPITPLPPAR